LLLLARLCLLHRQLLLLLLWLLRVAQPQYMLQRAEFRSLLNGCITQLL
jgi:hypothetical protein